MLGLQAQGASAIAQLSKERFGDGPTTFEVVELYAQTNGHVPPAEERPEKGAIIGVGIHYRADLIVEGTSTTVEGLTTFELGTRMGYYVDIDPNGLITREEAFYGADSLLASALVK